MCAGDDTLRRKSSCACLCSYCARDLHAHTHAYEDVLHANFALHANTYCLVNLSLNLSLSLALPDTRRVRAHTNKHTKIHARTHSLARSLSYSLCMHMRRERGRERGRGREHPPTHLPTHPLTYSLTETRPLCSVCARMGNAHSLTRGNTSVVLHAYTVLFVCHP